MGNINYHIETEAKKSNLLLPEDLAIFQYNENNLLDAKWLQATYAHCISEGIISRNDDVLYRKKLKLLEKSEMTENVLNVNGYNDQNGSEEFKRKRLKFLQREISILSENLDPYNNIMLARHQILLRIQKAYIRMQKRHSKNRNSCMSTLEEKQIFLKKYLDHENNILAIPSDLHDNMLENAHTLSYIGGIFGLSGEMNEHEAKDLKILYERQTRSLSQNERIGHLSSLLNRLERLGMQAPLPNLFMRRPQSIPVEQLREDEESRNVARRFFDSLHAQRNNNNNDESNNNNNNNNNERDAFQVILDDFIREGLARRGQQPLSAPVSFNDDIGSAPSSAQSPPDPPNPPDDNERAHIRIRPQLNRRILRDNAFGRRVDNNVEEDDDEEEEEEEEEDYEANEEAEFQRAIRASMDAHIYHQAQLQEANENVVDVPQEIKEEINDNEEEIVNNESINVNNNAPEMEIVGREIALDMEMARAIAMSMGEIDDDQVDVILDNNNNNNNNDEEESESEEESVSEEESDSNDDIIENEILEEQQQQEEQRQQRNSDELHEEPVIVNVNYQQLNNEDDEETPLLNNNRDDRKVPDEQKDNNQRYVLKDNEVYFCADKLLKSCLSHCVEEVKYTLLRLKATLSSNDNEEMKSTGFNISDNCSGMVQLLIILQRDLFRKFGVDWGALDMNDSEEKCKLQDKILFEYLPEILIQSNNVMKLVLELFQDSLKLDSLIMKVLYYSFIGQVLPLTLIVIYSFILETKYNNIATIIFDSLKQLLQTMDKLNICIKDIKELDELYMLKISNNSLHPINIISVESPHYMVVAPQEKLIHITGANFITVTFDERCHTERGRSHVELYNANGEPLLPHLSGTKFPLNPLVFHGDKFIIKFSSEDDQHYGYRMLVCGYNLEIPQILKDNDHNNNNISPFEYKNYLTQSILTNDGQLKINDETNKLKMNENNKKKNDHEIRKNEIYKTPWLFDIQNMTSRNMGRCIRVCIVGENVNNEEETYRKWLSSPLFATGFENWAEHKLQTFEKNLSTTTNIRGTVTISEDSIITPIKKRILSGSNQFLEDIIENTLNTMGSRLNKLMSEDRRKLPVEFLGGECVKRLVRMFIAILIKHLGLTNSASAFAQQGTNESRELSIEALSEIRTHLENIWSKSQKFHQYIISSFQSFTQNYHASKDDPSLPTPTEDEEKKLTYEGYCAPIIEKAEFLMSLLPCLNSPKSISDTPAFSLELEVTETLKLARANSSNKKSTNLDNFKSLFNVYSTLQHWNVHKTTRKRKLAEKGEGAMIDSLEDLLVGFLQNNTPVNRFIEFIHKHMERATFRANALNTMIELLYVNNLSSKLCRLGILYEWGPPFRRYMGYSAADSNDITDLPIEDRLLGGHYLRNIEAAGPKHRADVIKAFTNLYSEFSNWIKYHDTNNNDHIFTALVINSWAVDFIPYDHTFLMSENIIEQLEKLSKCTYLARNCINIDDKCIRYFNGNVESLIHRFSGLTNKFISNVLINFNNFSNDAAGGGQGYYDQLQIQTLEKLYDSIISRMNALNNSFQQCQEHFKITKIRDTIAFCDIETKQLCIDYVLIEKLAFKSLYSLCTISSSSLTLKWLQQSKIIKLLTTCLDQSSPRIQYLALRALSTILPNNNDDINNLLHDLPIYKKWSIIDNNNIGENFIKLLLKMLSHYLPINLTLDQEKYSINVHEEIINKYNEYKKGNKNPEEMKKMLNDVQYDSKTNINTMQYLPIKYITGEVILNMCDEIIQLIRTLYHRNNSIWSSIICKIIQQILSKLPIIIKNLNNNNSSADNNLIISCNEILAVISLIGGNNERFRAGNRVETIRKVDNNVNNNDQEYIRETGILVYVDNMLNKCLVLFDHTPTRVIICEREKLRPIITIEPISLESLGHETISTFMNVFILFAQPSNIELAIQERHKRIKNGAIEVQNLREEAENIAKLQADELKRRQAEMIPPIWNCEACTFENRMNDKTCAMCMTPQPSIYKEIRDSIAAEMASNNEHVTNIPDYVEEPRILVKNVHLLWHQLRSRILKVLYYIFQQPSENIFNAIVSSGVLNKLFNMAIRISPTDGFKSLERLERLETRLHELLIQKKYGIIDNIVRFKNQIKNSTILNYSPYKTLSVLMPTSLDIVTSYNINFLTDECCSIVYNNRQNNISLGAARSNHIIPNSLPIYYYEIRIDNLGEKKPSSTWHLALGLHRSGMSMLGMPGSQNSYGLSINGNLHFTKSSIPSEREYWPLNIKQGDTLGCGYNSRKKSIFFTINGKRINDSIDEFAFNNVTGRYYPIIWIENENLHITINFGQEPLLYDISNQIPESFLQEAKRQLNAPIKSSAEIRRTTAAEELVEIMGGNYPREICEVALERCRDDQVLAANWLLENGWREMENMANALMEASQREEEERVLRQQGIIDDELNNNNDSSDHDDTLGDWLSSSNNNYEENNQNTANNYLDDEIEADVPVGIEQDEIQQNITREARHHHHHPHPRNNEIIETFKLDELNPGQILCISSSALNIIIGLQQQQQLHIKNEKNVDNLQYIVRYLIGRSGVVTAIDINHNLVHIMIYDHTTAIHMGLWLPSQILVKPKRLKIDPCHNIRDGDSQIISTLLIETESALTLRRIRNALLHLLSASDMTTTVTQQILFNDPRQSLAFLKLIAADNLAASVTTSNGIIDSRNVSRRALNVLRERLTDLVSKENSIDNNNNIPQLRLTSDIYESKEMKYTSDLQSSLAISTVYDTKPFSLTQLVAEEVVLHFIQAVKFPPPVLTFRSEHPYSSHTQLRQKVHIPGANKLIVSFDPRCHIGTDMLTRLSFFRDEEFQDVILRCSGKFGHQNNILGRGTQNQDWQTFVVPSDTFWFRFSSSINSDCWGYSFKVRPVELHIDDSQALASLNFELGSWLSDFFFQDQINSKLVQHYAVDFYDAIVYYVNNVRPSLKNRGVEILVRIILYMHKNAKNWYNNNRLPNFKKLSTLATEIGAVLNEVAGRGSLRELQRLQGLVELLATVDLTKKSFESITNQKMINNNNNNNINIKNEKQLNRQIDLHIYGVSRINIVSALLGVVDDIDRCIDITEILTKKLQQVSGAQLQIFPEDLSPLIPPSARRYTCQLRVKYQCISQQYNGVTDQLEDKIHKEIECNYDINKKFVICPELSLFDRVVEISRLTLDMEVSGKLPVEFQLEAYRAGLLAESFYPVITTDNGIMITENGEYHGYPDPNVILGVQYKFTLSFWIFLTEKPSILNTNRSIIRKSNDSKSGFSVTLTSDQYIICTIYDHERTKRIIKSNKLINIGEWCNVVISCSNRVMRIYINGDTNNISELKIKKPIIANNHPFIVGKYRHPSLSSQHLSFNGCLKDVRYYLNDIPDSYVRRYYLSVTSRKVFNKNELNCQVDSKFAKTILYWRELRNIAGHYHDNNHNNNNNISKLTKKIHSRQHMLVKWTKDMDIQIIQLFTNIRDSMIVSRREIKPQMIEINAFDTNIRFTDKMLEPFDLINMLLPQDIKHRFSVIQTLNVKLVSILPLVDFSHASESWSLAHRLSTMSVYIFNDVKMKVFGTVLQQTSSGGNIRLTINRPRALKAQEKGDPDGRKSVFGQAYRKLHFIRPSLLRSEGRAWVVTYEGEGGQDVGGLFRDSVSHICQDLQSTNVPLFIPCPNKRGFGDNQEKWIPNPACTSSMHLSMYAFVGKLMGIAIRGKHSLNLDLPSLVWKPLIGQKVTRDDLKAVDSLCFDVLEKVSRIELENVNEETFSDYITYNFVTTSSDGREVELKNNGRNIPVTWHNRHEFVSLVEEYRLNEVKIQVEAIHRGLSTIVPVKLLPLFTWNELETMVCGERKVDIERLKHNTKYRHPFTSRHPTIKMLFRVLESFNMKQRQEFLRFVWGQSRLPFGNDDFSQKFEVYPARRNDDCTLPVSHTCFFSIELPRYSTEDIMREKLLYAIKNCWAIDTDHAVQNVDWNED